VKKNRGNPLTKKIFKKNEYEVVEANVAWVRAIGGKDENALFALATFSKLPKNLTFDHRLSQVEANVVLVRAIGGKDENALFALAAFSKLPKNLTFDHRLFVSKGQVKTKKQF
jgi:predicted DNA-binding transcriptional regulator YafY